jgi:hypothetical protein
MCTAEVNSELQEEALSHARSHHHYKTMSTQCDISKHNTTHYKTAQLRLQHNSQHNTTQHNTTQYNTTQYSTTHCDQLQQMYTLIHLLRACIIIQVQSARNLHCYLQTICSKNSRQKGQPMLNQKALCAQQKSTLTYTVHQNTAQYITTQYNTTHKTIQHNTSQGQHITANYSNCELDVFS